MALERRMFRRVPMNSVEIRLFQGEGMGEDHFGGYIGATHFQFIDERPGHLVNGFRSAVRQGGSDPK